MILFSTKACVLHYRYAWAMSGGRWPPWHPWSGVQFIELDESVRI